MNKVILVGRLTKDPEARYTQSESPLCITTYTLAVDRKFRKGEADFIKCKALGKNGEFADRYFKKGLRVSVSGRIETDSYTNRNGEKVYTTEVVVEEQEFAQSKNETEKTVSEDFIRTTQAELPFN